MKFEPTEKEKYVDMGYTKEDEIAIEDFEVHFIELPKFIKKNPSGKKKLDQWLWLLIGEEEKIEMAEKENEEIKKAKHEVELLSQDETERYIYELRQKAIRDEKNIRDSGYQDGLEAGLEAGRKEREQEIYELRQKVIRDEKNIRDSGYEDGKKEAKLEYAKKMLEEGIPLEKVIKITGLKEEEIKRIK